MSKYTIFITLLVLISCQHKIKDKGIIDHVISLHGSNNELFGISCNGKIVDSNIFITNGKSKKILHYIIHDNEVFLKDSFFYGNLWKQVLAEKFSKNANELYKLSNLYQRLGSQGVIADNNYNFGSSFSQNISVYMFDLVNGNRRPIFINKVYFQVKYISDQYVLEKLKIPDSLSTEGGNVINNPFKNQEFAYCRINQKEKYRHLFVYPLKDNELDQYLSSRDFRVSDVFDSVMPPIVQSHFLFSASHPFYLDLNDSKEHTFESVLPENVRSFYGNQKKGISNQFILASEQYNDSIYILTWEKKNLYVLSINSITGKSGLIRIINTEKIKEIESSYIYFFDKNRHLIIFNSHTSKFVFLNI